MRNISTSEISSLVKKLFISANYALPADVEKKLKTAFEKESCEACKSTLGSLCENLSAAKEIDVPICQDTGMAVVFAEVGQDVHIEGGLFEDAVNEGVKMAYDEGFLRKSIVADPLRRTNTGTNCPALIHTRLVSGDKIKITAAPKGFGSENMSRLKMFTPSATEDDICQFVVDSVVSAGSNPCPPVIVGVGIGSDFEGCALLAKKALIKNTDEPNADVFYSNLEAKMLEKINKTGIGAQGFGGDITALAVNIEAAPTHIAGLPVAVNMGCWVTRHKTGII